MTTFSNQFKNDVLKYYKGAYHASKTIPGRSKIEWGEWQKWIQSVINAAKQLTITKLKSHWSKNKNYYLSNDNIPDKWKKDKYYLYTWKHKSKKWLFVCTIEDYKVKVIGACNYKAISSDSNDEYVMLKESFISLTQYLNENLIPLKVYVNKPIKEIRV